MSSQLIHATVEGSHEFKIEGYSLTKGIGVGKFHTSSKFRAGNYNWVIKFYPDGNVQASKEYVSVFLNLVNPDCFKGVRAQVEFKLLDQTGKVIYERPTESPFMFTASVCSWGYTKFKKRSELEDSIKDDCFTIQCTVRLVETRVEKVKPPVEEGKDCVIPVPSSNMFQKIKDLLKSAAGFDTTRRYNRLPHIGA